MADIIDQSNMGMQPIEGVPGIKPAKRDRYDMIWYDIFHFLYVDILHTYTKFYLWPTNMGVQGPNINDMYIYIYYITVCIYIYTICVNYL